MAFVYAVVHNGIGDFLIFRKNVTGYFFHDPAGGGTVYANGQPIVNGPNAYAFPGGTPDNQANVNDGAIEEMYDETGVLLNVLNCSPARFSRNIPQNRYYGVYFNAGDQYNQVHAAALANLAQGENAANAVIARQFGVGQYNQLRGNFAGCPHDNELQHFCESWNMFNQWDEIEALNVPPTDWFYNIIINLCNTLFPVHIYDQDNNLVGIAKEMALGVGNVFTTNCILYNDNAVMVGGVYHITTANQNYQRMGLRFLAGQQGIAQFRQL